MGEKIDSFSPGTEAYDLMWLVARSEKKFKLHLIDFNEFKSPSVNCTPCLSALGEI